MELLAQTEGIFAEAVGGVVVGALKKLVASGKVKREELTVAVITGAGPRTQDIVSHTVRPFAIHPSLESFAEVLGTLA